MLKAIKNLSALKTLSVALVLTTVVAFLSLLPIAAYVPDLKFSLQDKIEHGMAYFFLAMSWFLVHYKFQLKKNLLLMTALAVVLFGIIIEILQRSITTYRAFDYFDIIANAIGVLLAFVLFIANDNIIQE